MVKKSVGGGRRGIQVMSLLQKEAAAASSVKSVGSGRRGIQVMPLSQKEAASTLIVVADFVRRSTDVGSTSASTSRPERLKVQKKHCEEHLHFLNIDVQQENRKDGDIGGNGEAAPNMLRVNKDIK
nr:hypothetical protein [Tanacetum cinerariifolium]